MAKINKADFKKDLEDLLIKYLTSSLKDQDIVYSGDNLLNLEDAMQEKGIGINKFVNSLCGTIDEYTETVCSEGSAEDVYDADPENNGPSKEEFTDYNDENVDDAENSSSEEDIEPEEGSDEEAAVYNLQA